jgi:hypothetical protein
LSIHELRDLLDQVADTREIVLRRPRSCAAYDAWSDARDETLVAYGRWAAAPAAESYAAYRAAQDREDAAQDSLARATAGRHS